MIFEGLFEQYRDLKVVLIECGFGWLPALGWRLDKHWERMRDEVPHLKRPPSEYIREHFWVSTQPMEEAEEPDHVIDAMRWIGFDRILFASDYPHWDFDDPLLALPPSLTEEQRARSTPATPKALRAASVVEARSRRLSGERHNDGEARRRAGRRNSAGRPQARRGERPRRSWSSISAASSSRSTIAARIAAAACATA